MVKRKRMIDKRSIFPLFLILSLGSCRAKNHDSEKKSFSMIFRFKMILPVMFYKRKTLFFMRKM